MSAIGGVGWVLFVLPFLLILSWFPGWRMYRSERKPVPAFLFSMAVYVLLNDGLMLAAQRFLESSARDVQFVVSLVLFLFVAPKPVSLSVGLVFLSAILFISFSAARQNPNPPIAPSDRSKLLRLAVVGLAAFSLFSTIMERTEIERMPVSRRKFIEKKVPYWGISSLTDVGGKPAYRATLEGGGSTIIHDGEDIGIKNAKITLYFINDLNGKPVYHAMVGKKSFIVYEGVEIGGPYDKVWPPIDVDGKLAYVARSGNETIIILNGKEVWKGLNRAGHLTAVKGKLAYSIHKESGFYIVLDGREIGGPYLSVDHLEAVGGHLIVHAELVKDSGRRGSVLIVDGKEYGTRYDFVMRATYTHTPNRYTLQRVFAGGEFAYAAQQNNEMIIVLGEKEVWRDANGSDPHLYEIDDRLGYAYVRRDTEGKTQQLYVDGKPASEKYSAIEGLAVSQKGQTAMRVKQGKNYSVILNGKRILKKATGAPVFLGESVFVHGRDHGKDFVYYEDGIIEPVFSNILEPKLIDGKLAFIGVRGRPGRGSDYFLVMEQ